MERWNLDGLMQYLLILVLIGFLEQQRGASPGSSDPKVRTEPDSRAHQ